MLDRLLLSHGFHVELARPGRPVEPGDRLVFADLTDARAFLAPMAADHRDYAILRQIAGELAPGSQLREVDEVTARVAAALVDGRIGFVRVRRRTHGVVASAAPKQPDVGAGGGKDSAVELTWVEARLLDPGGTGIANQRVVVVAADGERHTAYTDSLGLARIDPIPAGTCKILYPDLTADAVPKSEDPPPPPTRAEAQGRFTVHDLVVGVTRPTAETHELRLLVLTIRVRLEIDPNDSASRDDRFILRATKGSAEQQIIKTIKDDQVPGDASVDLVYEHLWRDHRYTLEVDPGAEGEPYLVFKDVGLSTLLQI